MSTVTPLRTLHPLEAEAEQLGILAAWCDLHAAKAGTVHGMCAVHQQAFECRAKQIIYLELFGRSQGIVQ